MKKTNLLGVLFASLLIVSCKKSYTCDCVTTEVISSNSSTQTLKYNNSSTPYSEKMNEKQAKSACQHEQDELVATYNALMTNNGTQPADPQDVVTVSCNLK